MSLRVTANCGCHARSRRRTPRAATIHPLSCLLSLEYGVNMSGKKIAVLVIILAALAGVISFVIWFSNHGFSAREKPSWVETVLAKNARKIATPAGAKELKNPQPVTEAST